jgi:hypothetical protein
MVAEFHLVDEAKRLLVSPDEQTTCELAWSAADHGCPEILEMALPHLAWPGNDPRWEWVMMQPIRGAGADSARNGGHFKSMEVLLRHGIDPNVSRGNRSLLHYTAARHGQAGGEDRAKFAGMLIDYGARLTTRDDMLRSTPLGWACRWGHEPVVELLLRRGAPVREPDAEPWATPEAWARKMNHISILAMLEGNHA